LKSEAPCAPDKQLDESSQKGAFFKQVIGWLLDVCFAKSLVPRFYHVCF
jgi:hypothetical protein